MDLGSLAMGLGNAGQGMIAGQEYQQVQADTQMKQMKVLMMRQELQAKTDLQTDMKAGMASVQGGIKSEADTVKGLTQARNLAYQRGEYGEVKAMDALLKEAQGEVKQSQDNQKQAMAQASEAAGQAALAYEANPTQATAGEVVRKAIAAGVPVEAIPPSTDAKAFGRFAASLPDKARSVEKVMEYRQKNQEMMDKLAETKRHNQESEEARLESIRNKEADKQRDDFTKKLLASMHNAELARVAEAKAAAKAAKGPANRVGMIEQKTADTIIRNSAQGVRVLNNLLELPGSAAASLFSKIKDTSLSDSLVRTGGNIITPEADQAVTAIGAEMGVIVGQVVTAGSGRGAALPIVDSFQKMTTPQIGDSPHMKLLRMANAGEILKLELENIPEGATPQLEKNRQDMITFLGKLPTTKDVIRVMPAAGREKTMGQFMDMTKQTTALRNQANGLPREAEAAPAPAALPTGWK